MPKQQGATKAQQSSKYTLGRSSSTTDLSLPSGALALVRQPGLQGLIREGVLEDMDTLTKIVATETIPKAKGQPKQDPKPPSTKQVLEAMDTMDRIMVAVVVEPHVEVAPEDSKDRVEGVVYADTVSLADKAFIVQYAMGGSSSLEEFRAGPAAALVGLPTG